MYSDTGVEQSRGTASTPYVTGNLFLNTELL